MGILIENFIGRFPLWISPAQVKIITVADRHAEYAHTLAAALRKEEFCCDVDDTAESVNKKIRNAQMMQYNYMLTVGDKELENQTIALRTRDNVVHGEMDFETFIAAIKKECAERSLHSHFSSES
jgi:threonyl-tRNA synthetase